MRTLLALVLLSACQDYNYVRYEGVDVFYQEPAAEVDVLLVIDNSCSMEPYQEKLSTNFDAFLTYFIEGNVDYRIGVVTTSVAETSANPAMGCSQADADAVPEGGHLINGAVVGPDTENGAQVFSDIVQVGVCGSGMEMGLESAYRALTPPLSVNQNVALLRDTADLSIIFVSDEEDSSPMPVNDYTNAFAEVKGARDRDVFNASSLIVTDVDACNMTQQQSGATEGTRYYDVAERTGGVLGDICSQDFESIVTELSLATSRLTDTFYLSSMPSVASLFVSVDDAEMPCEDGGWVYELGRSNGTDQPMIVFDVVPPPNSQISVRYDYGSGDPADFCTDGSSGGDDTGGA